MSVLSAAFARTRDAAAFRAWAQAEPGPATAWLRLVAKSLRAEDVLEPLLARSGPRATQDLTDALSRLEGRSIATVQAERAASLGWTAATKVDPPALTGTLTMDRGAPVLTTPQGTFTVVNAEYVRVDGNKHDLPGRDVQAFAGRTVTVRGWPDATWKPGSQERAKLFVEEFAPGASPDFVSGRVVVSGEAVKLQVRPDKQVRLTDPALCAVLKAHDGLGLILPGAARRQGDAYVFDGAPKDYYFLAGFNDAKAFAPAAGVASEFDLQLAHGTTMRAQMPKVALDQGPKWGQRHYFFGHLGQDLATASSYSPFAGFVGKNLEDPDGASAPSARFVEWATPVEPVASPDGDARFAP